ncbi:MAG: DUF4235 domain-containing protein [Bacteroidales bacterium]|nr:DUF4235 domain-containing protein [Bacteroidales bacterium]
MTKKRKIQKRNKGVVFLRRTLMRGIMMTGSYYAGKGLDTGYHLLTGDEAPKDPGKKKSNWTKVIVWAAVTGAIIGAAKAAIRPGVRKSLDRMLPE